MDYRFMKVADADSHSEIGLHNYSPLTYADRLINAIYLYIPKDPDVCLPSNSFFVIPHLTDVKVFLKIIC